MSTEQNCTVKLRPIEGRRYLLGNSFLREYTSIYDNENKRVGLFGGKSKKSTVIEDLILSAAAKRKKWKTYDNIIWKGPVIVSFAIIAAVGLTTALVWLIFKYLR